MRTVFAPFLLLVIACGGKAAQDTGFADHTNCDGDWAQAPLNTVAASDWRDGVTDAVGLLPELHGLWRTMECGDADAWVDLKIEAPSSDDMTVFTEQPEGGHECGCLEDPDFVADNAYRPVARADLQVFIEDYPDPAIDQTNRILPITFFSPGEALKARGCVTWRLDSSHDQQWTYATLIVRVDEGNILDGTVLLDDGTQTTTCALTSWERRPS